MPARANATGLRHRLARDVGSPVGVKLSSNPALLAVAFRRRRPCGVARDAVPEQPWCRCVCVAGPPTKTCPRPGMLEQHRKLFPSSRGEQSDQSQGSERTNPSRRRGRRAPSTHTRRVRHPRPRARTSVAIGPTSTLCTIHVIAVQIMSSRCKCYRGANVIAVQMLSLCKSCYRGAKVIAVQIAVQISVEVRTTPRRIK